MTTLQKPTTKAKRTLRFTANTDDMSPTAGVLTICDSGVCDSYLVTEYSTGRLERGFQLTKLLGDGAGYAVECSREHATCECDGHKFRGRKRACRHIAAVRKLIEMKRL